MIGVLGNKTKDRKLTIGGEEVFGTAYDSNVVKRIIPYILAHKKSAIVALVSMLIFSATQVAFPWLIKVGIDSFISNGDFAGLTLVFGIFIVLAVLNLGSNFVQQLSMTIVAQGILYRLRKDMFAHLQKLSISFYDKTELGRIISRVQGDVGQLQEFMTILVVTLGDLISLVGIVVVLFILNTQLALISMLVLPIFAFVLMVWQPYALRAFIRVRTAASIVNGNLNESITGVRVVQSMNRQAKNMTGFDSKTAELKDSSQFANKLSAGLMPLVDILMGVAIALAILFGSRMIITNAFEIGAMIAFVLYIQRFFDPVRNLAMQYTQLQRSMASGIRIFELLDKKPDFEDSQDAVNMPQISGRVELKNVTFGYGAEDVVKDVNIQIEAGQTVAIVGPTGAGKTTLVSLINRFYDVQQGKGGIFVDGFDIRGVTRHSLSSQMSMVLQEPFLFSGTVRENIKYVHKDVSDSRMVEVSKAVGAHDFIMELEFGYDTYLHERGVNLSVGQRQLLSFARAIITDPKILILDEATANIDSHTEVMVQKAMINLLRGRTSIVIAHRLSTIRDADKIVVLQDGEVIETGNHAELMASEGLYAHLYQMNYKAMESTVNIDANGSNGKAAGHMESSSNFGPAVVNPKIKPKDRVGSRLSHRKQKVIAS